MRDERSAPVSNHALAPRDTFEQYMSEVNRIPLLSRQEEDELTSTFSQSQDPAIAHRLVVSNLRFVVRIANEYRGYGLKLIDLVQEGNLGLMIAVQKFDHQRLPFDQLRRLVDPGVYPSVCDALRLDGQTWNDAGSTQTLLWATQSTRYVTQARRRADP